MENTNNNEMIHFIRMIVIVVIIFFAFYFITIVTTGNKKGSYTNKETTPSVIQYDEIILGDLYNQNENEYYVLVEEKDDPYLTFFTNVLKQYAAEENGIPYYTVDLSSAFNQKFYSETSSFEPNNLKFSETTLLKIKNKTIVEYYHTSEDILNIVNNLNK